MSIIVQKFGGTSVGDIKKIQNIVDKIIGAKALGEKIIIVVSAMAGVTNQLASYCLLLSDLNSSSNLAEYDVALSSGEIVTASLLALALQQRGIRSHSVLSWQLPIKTDNSFSKALIEDIDPTLLHHYLDLDIVPIIAGFQGVTENGQITTLGRGGSDTTAVAVAASVRAKRCDIYTDVEGVFTTDPRLVNTARKIDVLSYEEMLEFTSMGAKVLHTRAVQIGMRYEVPIQILSSFFNVPGTMITRQGNIMEQTKITGIAHNKNIASLSIKIVNLKQRDNIIASLAAGNVNIENIQRLGDFDISIIIALSDLSIAKKVLDEIDTSYQVHTDIAFVSVIGYGIKNDPALLGEIISILSSQNIEILMMLSSEIKISLMVKEDETERVVKIIHKALIE